MSVFASASSATMVVTLRVPALLMACLIGSEVQFSNHQVGEAAGALAFPRLSIGGDEVDMRQSLGQGMKAFRGLRRKCVAGTCLPLESSVSTLISRVNGLFSFLLSGSDPARAQTGHKRRNLNVQLAEAARMIRNGARIVCNNVWDSHFVNKETGKVGHVPTNLSVMLMRPAATNT